MPESIRFTAARLTDAMLVAAVRAIARRMSALGNDGTIRLVFAGSYERQIGSDTADDQQLTDLFSEGSTAIRSIYLQQPNVFSVSITRPDNERHDLVDISIGDQGDVRGSEKSVILVATAKRELRELRFADTGTGAPLPEFGRFLAAQEASLARLHDIAAKITNEQSKNAEAFAAFMVDQRAKLDEEIRASREKALLEIESERDRRLADARTAEESVKILKADLETAQAQYDLSDAKRLRRQLREKMLERLKEYSQNFELTEGAKGRRWPVNNALLGLILFSGSAAVLLFGFERSFALQDVAHIIGYSVTKAVSVTVLLGAIWYFIRWNNAWARQHADAEFRLKQLELDLNRASWVVELAFEWRAENKDDLPKELVERLSRNLFEVEPTAADHDQPTDLASVLVGAASSLKLKAGSTEVDIDRKGIRQVAATVPKG